MFNLLLKIGHYRGKKDDNQEGYNDNDSSIGAKLIKNLILTNLNLRSLLMKLSKQYQNFTYVT